MSVRFTHLKIAGFKSFSDSTTIEILPGLTGIIGPNGCGKSNIVEAIRWVMGESSARSLRGGEMDDVIFAGTARRAARNIAEVSLTLEDTEEIAPPPFQNQNQLQISRQIERGSGSQYRINSKLQRARDVQTLFADMGSGPRSSAIISQNRIAQLISASPEERRVVLEEAAGIAGLYSRRREAELKLKATEENLARLDDLRQQLTLLIESLNEQSVQATQYRTLSAELRETESNLQTLYYQRALRSLAFFVTQVKNAQRNQIQHADHLQQCQKQIEQMEEQLPLLRQKETQTRIQWEEKRQHIRSLKEEKDRLLQQIEQLKERIQEANIHHNTATERVNKSNIDLQSIESQIKVIQDQLSEHPQKVQQTTNLIQELEQEHASSRKNSQQLEQNLLQQTELYQQLTNAYERAKINTKNIEDEYQELVKEYKQCQDSLPNQELLQQYLDDQELQSKALTAIIQDQQNCETDYHNAQLHVNQLQHQAQQIHDKYKLATQQITERQEQKDKIIAQIQTLRNQLQTIQQQSLSADQQQEIQSKIDQLQHRLKELKQQTETAQTLYQQAIKERLEQETLYHQANQSYEQTQNALLNAQNSLQQAEKALQHIQKQVETAQNNLVSAEILQSKQSEFSQKQSAFDQSYIEFNNLTLNHQKAKEDTEHFQETYNQHKNKIQQLKAKCEGLTQALSFNQEDDISSLPPIIEELTIPAEWITAIAAIFDDSLETPASATSSKGWSELPKLSQHYPVDIQILSDIISPPPALKRAFDAIGIVNSVEEGNLLAPTLQAGQSLITMQGDVWRWDGYHQNQHVQNRAAQRLLQRQTLQQAEKELSLLTLETTTHHQHLQNSQLAQKGLLEKLQHAQKIMQENDKQLQQAKTTFLTLQNNANAAQTQFEALQPAYEQAQQEWKTKQDLLQQIQIDAKHPKPDSQNVQNSQSKEQKSQDNAKRLQHQLQIAEQQYSSLKDQYQQQLSQDQQNQLRLENTQEKITQLENDLQQTIQDIQTFQHHLTQIASPDEAYKKSKSAQHELTLLEQKIISIKQEYIRCNQTFIKTQHAYQSLKEQYIQQNSRIETLKPRHDSLQTALQVAQQELHQVTSAYKQRPDPSPLQEELKYLRANEHQQKEIIEEQKLSYHLLLSQKENLIKQQDNLSSQYTEWQQRLEQTTEEAKDSQKKLNELQQQLDQLQQQPDQLQNTISELNQAEKEAQQLYINAQQELMVLEQERGKAKQNLQITEQQAMKSREDLLKAQAKQEQAQALLDQLKDNIDPAIQQQSAEHTSLDISDKTEKTLKQTLTQLNEQRDELGAVNLRAEIEREEKQTTLDNIAKEYNDLDTAIQQLKDSIQKLNQQSKEKLHAIFSEVDKHFQELFTRMFNGGSAYLKLLTHEDPLQSGLEIYVQPPGKKLSTLSLLSGGEQALTTLSLVFAVSRCNPVPICVLDEVDAPLDDPNVERFCTLLTDMSHQAGTRFLVVTHHQLTMSHMNRLYGVTMQERGVSQIISIDLEHAVQMQQEKHTEQLGLI